MSIRKQYIFTGLCGIIIAAILVAVVAVTHISEGTPLLILAAGIAIFGIIGIALLLASLSRKPHETFFNGLANLLIDLI